MAQKEPIQTARAEHLYVRIDRSVDSVHNVHRILAAVLQAGAACARAASEASVRQPLQRLSIQPIVVVLTLL